MTIAQKILLGIVLLEIPFQLDKYLDYHSGAAAYGAIGGWNISITTVCLLLLYAVWIPHAAIQKTRPTRLMLAALLPALIYVATVAVSIPIADSPKLAGFELFSTLQALMLLVFLVNFVRHESDVRFVVLMLLIGLIAEGALMVLLKTTGHGFTIASIQARIDENGRVGGTIGAPNEAASYLNLLLPIALGCFMAFRAPLQRALALAAFGIGCLALITTMSRGGWGGCAVGIGLFCAIAWSKGWLSASVPVFIVATVVVVLGVYHDTINERLTGHDKGSAYSRIPLMKMAGRLIAERPVFGVGANNMALAIQPIAEETEYRAGFVYVVHNRYLQVFAETGVFGLSAFVLFLVATIRFAWKGWMLADPFHSPIALGILAGVAGEMLHISVETFSGRPQVQTLWTVSALASAIYLVGYRNK